MDLQTIEINETKTATTYFCLQDDKYLAAIKLAEIPLFTE